MKFGSYLKGHRVVEWKNYYIDYRTLKKLIKRAAPKADGDDSDREDDDSDHAVASPVSPTTPLPQVESPRSERPRSGSRNAESEDGSLAKDDLGDVENMSTMQDSSARSTSFLRNKTVDSVRSDSPTVKVKKRRDTGGIGRRTITSSFRRQNGMRFAPGTPIAKMVPHLNENERKLFSVFDRELDKVESFYIEQESKTIARFRQIEDQLEELERVRKANEQYRMQHTHSHYVPDAVHDTFQRAVPSALTAGIKRVVSHVEPTAIGKAANPTEGSGKAAQAVAAELRTDTAWRPESYTKAKRTLKEAIFEEYRFLGMLKSYRSLNRQGFSKALKKAEKVTRIPCSQVFMEKVNQSRFVTSSSLDELTSKAERMFADHFEGGSRKKALERLRLLGVKKTHHGAAGRAGTWLGLAIPALAAGVVKSFDPEFRARTPEWPALMQLFGALSLPVVLGVLLHVNLLVWHRARINWPLIFELDLRTKIDWHQYLELPAFLFCLLCYAFWLSMNNFWPGKLSPDVWPLVWIVTTIVILVNPLPMFHIHARYWFLKSLGRLFTFGLIPVAFPDFWLGDQLTSLYYLWYNFGYVICTYHRDFRDVPPQCSTNDTWASPILASIPSLIRLAQSIRRYVDSSGMSIHAANAGKYGASIIYFFAYFNWRINGSETSGSRLAVFILFAIINSTYSAIWDLTMDWGLLKRHGRHPYLRPELIYKNAIWIYPLAMCIDTVLRFSWVIYLAPEPSVQLRGWLVAISETLRRSLWNLLRVESEHIGNADAYRVTRDVPLPFILQNHKEEAEDHAEPADNALSSWALHPVAQLTRSFRSGEEQPERPQAKRKTTLMDRVRGITSESSDHDATGEGSSDNWEGV